MTKKGHNCEICDLELKDNAEQSQHYNKAHRGASYKSLYTDLIIDESKEDKVIEESNDKVVLGKVDKQVRFRN